MVYDIDTRQADITALDTATALTTLGGNTPGNFIVPGDAHYISEIRISAAPDWTADDYFGFSSSIRINPGGGIKSGGELSFGGPCGHTEGAAATSAGTGVGEQEIYQVNIPVKSGEFSIDGFMNGEDIGSLRLAVTIVYDGPLGQYPIVDADCRESDLTAANTLVRLVVRNGATVNSLRPTTGNIGEVRINAGCKFVAGPLGTIVTANLYGAALKNGGNFQFAGPSLWSQDDAAISGGSTVNKAIVYKTGRNFPVKTNTNFDIQAQETNDDVGTVFPIVTICYI